MPHAMSLRFWTFCSSGLWLAFFIGGLAMGLGAVSLGHRPTRLTGLAATALGLGVMASSMAGGLLASAVWDLRYFSI